MPHEEIEKRDSDNELLVDMIEFTDYAFSHDIPIKKYHSIINNMLKKISTPEKRNQFRKTLSNYRVIKYYSC